MSNKSNGKILLCGSKLLDSWKPIVFLLMTESKACTNRKNTKHKGCVACRDQLRVH